MCGEDKGLSETLSVTQNQVTSGTPGAQSDADAGHVCLLTSRLDDMQVFNSLNVGRGEGAPSSSTLTRPLWVVQQNA